MSYQLLIAILPNLLLGMVLGVAGGLLGIGGGLIAIPILAHFYGMDQQLAQGTALVMIAPNVLIGFIRYRQKNNIELRSIAAMALASMLSTYIAARCATGLDPRHLQVGFALFLICLSLYFGAHLLRTSRPRPQPDGRSATGGAPATVLPNASPTASATASPRMLPLIGAASGVMSGLFTVGGGLVVVPALVTLYRMSQTRAQGIALALVVPGALVALFTYSGAGHVSWATGIPLALGGIVSVSWGVTLAHQFAPAKLRLLFCTVLLATAFSMLF
jgi:uncharacterized membrane protein YfcA